MIVFVAVVELITLHMVDGRIVQVNPAQITQVINPGEHGNTTLIDTVKCVVRLTDGSFVSVAETCKEVQQAIEK
jgi:ABC-type branched-subunit amino acid transport system ATPase component